MPIAVRLPDSVTLKIHASGKRTNKDTATPFTIEKVVRPQPLKNPRKQKPNATSIKSILKVLRYAVPAAITAGSALKICKIDAGET